MSGITTAPTPHTRVWQLLQTGHLRTSWKPNVGPSRSQSFSPRGDYSNTALRATLLLSPSSENSSLPPRGQLGNRRDETTQVARGDLFAVLRGRQHSTRVAAAVGDPGVGATSHLLGKGDP